MEKIVLFSDDYGLRKKLMSVYTDKDIDIKNTAAFSTLKGKQRLILIDGDALSLKACQPYLKTFKRKNIPVVFLFENLGGKEAMAIMEKGAVDVMFKDYSGTKMKRKIKEILYNFNYLEKVKELAESDAKTKKFLDVVKTLTSDSDINEIIVSILNSMKEVFGLGSIVFFMVTGKRLKQKIALGTVDDGILGIECNWDDPSIEWLWDIRRINKPIYISGTSKKSYKKYFNKNTLLLPLIIKGNFFGIIAVSFAAPSRKPSKSEIELLKAFSEQAALALENAQLYRDVIKAREELVNQEKKSLLGQIVLSLNHEINNPLSIISMEAQLLQHRMADKEGKVEARLHNIESNIERIKTILETISSLDVDEQLTTEYIDGRQMLSLM